MTEIDVEAHAPVNLCGEEVGVNAHEGCFAVGGFADKEEHGHDFPGSAHVDIVNVLLGFVVHSIAFGQQEGLVVQPLLIGHLIEEGDRPEHSLRIGFFAADRGVQKIAVDTAVFGIIAKELQTQSVAEFHIRGTSAEEPFTALEILSGAVIQREPVDLAADFFDIVCILLEAAELLDVYHVIVTGQDDGLFALRTAFQISGDDDSVEGIVFQRNQPDVVFVLCEIRNLIKQLLQLPCGQNLILCAGNAGNLDEPFHVVIHSVFLNHMITSCMSDHQIREVPRAERIRTRVVFVTAVNCAVRCRKVLFTTYRYSSLSRRRASSRKALQGCRCRCSRSR